MTDEIKSNLEPIEEKDTNLKEKFVGGMETMKPEKEKTESGYSVEREIKENISEKETAYSKILSRVNPQKNAIHTDADVSDDAKKINAEIDAESKITDLVKLAEAKGVVHAVKVARHMEDNYTLDEFHDRLLGEELRKALVEKGMIKEI
jgi:hypothetical protein